MLGDPRKGYVISLGLGVLAMLWLLGQWLDGEAVWRLLFPLLGYGVHALTLLAIFVLLAALLVALLFRRYAAVRDDLRAGRDVIARWTVDEALFRKFATKVDADDASDKRQALMTMAIAIAVVFGGFALFDPEVAPAMMGMALAIAVVLFAAYRWGEHVRRRHLQYRSGVVIVGRRGLLVNDVLHVWDVPLLSRLIGAKLVRGRRTLLEIGYVTFSRAGPQMVGVLLPVPAAAEHQAVLVCRELRQD